MWRLHQARESLARIVAHNIYCVRVCEGGIVVLVDKNAAVATKAQQLLYNMRSWPHALELINENIKHAHTRAASFRMYLKHTWRGILRGGLRCSHMHSVWVYYINNARVCCVRARACVCACVRVVSGRARELCIYERAT